MFEIIFICFMILVGILLLIKGADFLVEGCANIARGFDVSPLLIGLTVAAFGTSLPEFVVSMFSVLGGVADISIGTIIGSNIANLGIGIGIAAMIVPLTIHSKTLMYEFPFMIISTLLLLILANDHYIFGKDTFILGRLDGFIYIIIFFIFLYYIYSSMKKGKSKTKVDKDLTVKVPKERSLLKNIFSLLAGIIALIGGAKLLIDYGTDLARIVGFSDIFIGLTIAALGTSLPDIVTTITAAAKGHGDLAIGNIVGSNIFNILFVLGFTSAIKPFTINPNVLVIDGMILLLLSLLFLIFATTYKEIKRHEGAILLLIYVVYFVFLIWRL
jgi:cation:H+ antiporter